jgi:hypothetical protein
MQYLQVDVQRLLNLRRVNETKIRTLRPDSSACSVAKPVNGRRMIPQCTNDPSGQRIHDRTTGVWKHGVISPIIVGLVYKSAYIDLWIISHHANSHNAVLETEKQFWIFVIRWPFENNWGETVALLIESWRLRSFPRKAFRTLTIIPVVSRNLCRLHRNCFMGERMW